MKQGFDTYDKMPMGMREYLAEYGWHFSAAMLEFALSGMKGRNGEKLAQMKKDAVCELLKRNGVEVPQEDMYDAAYIANMCRADYYGSSIADEAHLAKFVDDYLKDKDGYDGKALHRFYADCIASGKPIYWSDML